MQQKVFTPLFLPVIFWAGGIIFSHYISLPMTVYFVIITFTFTLAFLKKSNKYFFILLLFFLLACLNYSVKEKIKNKDIEKLTSRFPNFTQPIKGMIVSEVKASKEKYYFDLALEQINDTKINGNIRLYTKDDNLEYGDIIFCVANIIKIPEVSNPNSFDQRKYLNSNNIYALGFAKNSSEILGNNANRLTKILITLRKFIRSRISRRCGKYSGFIRAILIAERDEINEEKDILRNAGLSHLLAVSGLHVAIISLIIYALLNSMLPGKFLSRIFTILVLVLYAAICNFTPSVSRAVIMISLFFISKIFNRKTEMINILAISLFIITFIEPNELFSIGLQMSFVAVFTLGLFIPKIRLIPLPESNRLLGFSIHLINNTILIMLSSAVLSIFLAPLTIYNFHQFNLNGIFANIIGIPIISVVIGLALIVIFIPNVWGLLEIYQASFQFVLDFFFAWSKFTADFIFFWDFVSLQVWQILVIYIALFSLFLPKIKNRFRFIAIFILLITIFANQPNTRFKVTFFDCNLGDLILIEDGDKHTILIDSGPPDNFINSALPYLKNNMISDLDYVIITHAHSDHFGGLEDAIKNLNVKNILLTDEFMTRRIWDKFEPLLITESTNIITVTDTFSLKFPEYELQILHPDKGYHSGKTNNLSIVTRLELDGISFLFTGDAEHEAEEYLIQKYSQLIDVDVLKIGHHGSKTASSEDFIKAVSPEFGIISTAVKNRFNFPHSETLEKYQFLQDNLMITGKEGAIQFVKYDNFWEVTTFKTKKRMIIKY
jgi:competence protein ComEC